MKNKITGIEGSSHDKVSWDITPFKPGKIFWEPKKIGKIKITRKKIVLRVPCRIDFSCLDYSKLKPTDKDNDYKAGEISFAANLYSYVNVELLDKSKIIINSERRLLVEHMALLMKKILKYEKII